MTKVYCKDCEYVLRAYRCKHPDIIKKSDTAYETLIYYPPIEKINKNNNCKYFRDKNKDIDYIKCIKIGTISIIFIISCILVFIMCNI